jgi:small nuclear ribonucleoprotein (snRNP)-like protein
MTSKVMVIVSSMGLDVESKTAWTTTWRISLLLSLAVRRSRTFQTATDPPHNSLMSSDVLDTIHRLLGSRIRVTMTDGRIVTGKFTCLDRLGNIILEDVVEQRWLAYHDVYADNKYSENPLTTVVDDKNTDAAVNGLSQQIVQQTKDERGAYHWITKRSMTQAVIIGRKVKKVEITRQQWEAKVVGENIEKNECA